MPSNSFESSYLYCMIRHLNKSVTALLMYEIFAQRTLIHCSAYLVNEPFSDHKYLYVSIWPLCIFKRQQLRDDGNEL